MKYRTGFVSNSSSSSFIIAAKPKERLVANLKTEIDVADYVRDSISSIEELEKYIVKKHSWGNSKKSCKEILDGDTYTKEEYDKIKDFILKGLVVHIGDASSDGEIIEQMVCGIGVHSLEFKDEVIIVESEAGY